MLAGLPITALGGLFYLLLSLGMPFVELYRLLRGRGTPGAWPMMARIALVQGGILATIAAQAALVNAMIPGADVLADRALDRALGVQPAATLGQGQTAGLIASSTLVALVTLAMLAVLVQALRGYFELRRRLAAG